MGHFGNHIGRGRGDEHQVGGVGKADIIKKAFFGPVTPEVPASILQMHPDFTLVLDAEAASKLD